MTDYMRKTFVSWSTKCTGSFYALGFVMIGANFVAVRIAGPTGSVGMQATVYEGGVTPHTHYSATAANPVLRFTIASHEWQLYYNNTGKTLEVASTGGTIDHLGIFSFQ